MDEPDQKIRMDVRLSDGPNVSGASRSRIVTAAEMGVKVASALQRPATVSGRKSLRMRGKRRNRRRFKSIVGGRADIVCG